MGLTRFSDRRVFEPDDLVWVSSGDKTHLVFCRSSAMQIWIDRIVFLIGPIAFCLGCSAFVSGWAPRVFCLLLATLFLLFGHMAITVHYDGTGKKFQRTVGPWWFPGMIKRTVRASSLVINPGRNQEQYWVELVGRGDDGTKPIVRLNVRAGMETDFIRELYKSWRSAEGATSDAWSRKDE